jgi:hypothetical protein
MLARLGVLSQMFIYNVDSRVTVSICDWGMSNIAHFNMSWDRETINVEDSLDSGMEWADTLFECCEFSAGCFGRLCCLGRCRLCHDRGRDWTFIFWRSIVLVRWGQVVNKVDFSFHPAKFRNFTQGGVHIYTHQNVRSHCLTGNIYHWKEPLRHERINHLF